MSSDTEFTINVEDIAGKTEVEGKDPFYYVKENDEQDERLGKAIQYAIEDLT